VIAAIISPEGLFLFLVNASGAIALLVYLMVAISELRLRRVIEQRAPERLTLKMWAYPWLTYLTIIAISAVLISMAMIEATRTQFFLSLVAVAVALVAYAIRVHAGREVAGPAGPAAPESA
jgi:GABA permease